MYRRAFLLSSAAALALPQSAAAVTTLTFNPTDWRAQRDTDDIFILNYRAKWSLTCDIKLELIAKLLAENPDYARLTFIEVDWDTFGRSQMTQRLKVTRRSTLVVMKRGKEITRIENQPYERKMRAFLDAALDATRAA